MSPFLLTSHVCGNDFSKSIIPPNIIAKTAAKFFFSYARIAICMNRSATATRSSRFDVSNIDRLHQNPSYDKLFYLKNKDFLF